MTPFDFVAERLTAESSLTRLEARGTVRLALKSAGLDASATAGQLEVVLTKVLPGELAAQGIEGPEAVCAEIAQALAGQSFDAPASTESPEEIFRRLAGG